MIKRSGFDAITFDCYGTLIDWETGISAALRSIGLPIGESKGGAEDREGLLESFARLEAEEERRPFTPYAGVLRRVQARLLGEREGPAATSGVDPDALSKSIADWPAFADVPTALRALGADFRLMVVSNIDRDLFELSRPKLGTALDGVVTAEDVRSYKPGRPTSIARWKCWTSRLGGCCMSRRVCTTTSGRRVSLGSRRSGSTAAAESRGPARRPRRRRRRTG